MDLDLSGRHVVVTGATGALGSAVVSLLGAQGAVLHLPTRGAGVDLSDEEAVRRFYAALPALSASIHCAGGFALAPFADTSLAELRDLLDRNAVTAFLCSREAIRSMRRNGGRGGRIVNVAATAGVAPRTAAGKVAYAMAKAAVVALTEALAEEAAREGILVTAVAPATLDTPANRAAMPTVDPAGWARTEDAAAVIAFLASPRNRCARGAVVPVAGRA